MDPGEGTHDRQADPATESDVFITAANERFEDRVEVVTGDPGSVVIDAHDDVVVGAYHADRDRTGIGGILVGVGQQVGDRMLDLRGVDDGRCRLEQPHPDLAVGKPRPIDRSVDDLPQVDGLPVRFDAAVRDLSEVEEVLQVALQATCVRGDAFQ